MNSLSIPEIEFSQRLGKTRKAMVEKGVDLLLAFSTESEPAYVRYYLDYWPSFETAGILIAESGNDSLLIGPESRTFADARSKLPRVVRMMDFRESSQPAYPGSTLATWKEVLSEHRPRRLGIAGWHLIPHAIFENIREALGGTEIVNADEIVRGVTRTKSAAELECLREAARIPAERIIALRIDQPHDLGGATIPELRQYAVRVTSDQNLVAQFGRLDTTQANLAYYGSNGFHE